MKKWCAAGLIAIAFLFIRLEHVRAKCRHGGRASCARESGGGQRFHGGL
jgi:hypothetical protein